MCSTTIMCSAKKLTRETEIIISGIRPRIGLVSFAFSAKPHYV